MSERLKKEKPLRTIAETAKKYRETNFPIF